MHPYTTDSSEKKFIPLYIACLGVVLAWTLNWILRAIQFTLPWWIDAPSVIGFYGLFYNIFDKYIWKSIEAIFKKIDGLKFSEKMMLRELILRVNSITNRMEDASDRLDLVVLKLRT